MKTVALWYRRYRDVEYMLLDDEETAARQAAYMLCEGEGSPAGVQFEDGRLIEAEDWKAFAAALERCRALQQPVPPSKRPSRKIRAPFTGNWLMDVPEDAPRWLGLPVRDAGRDAGRPRSPASPHKGQQR